MSLQTALVDIKNGSVALNLLIGERFHPDVLPQEVTLPAVTYSEVSRQRFYQFGVVPDMAHPRVQLDGYATTSVARSTLAAAMRDAFNRRQGHFGNEDVLDIRIDNERQDVEMLDTETQAYRITIDLLVDFRE